MIVSGRQNGLCLIEENNKLVLVTGATGAIGPRIVQALHKEACRVRTFSIDSPEKSIFPVNVEAFKGDINDQAAVLSVMQGVDEVIHLAALLHVLNPPADFYKKYEQVNVGGTANVVQAARAANVKRLIFFSTIAIYGHSREEVLDENSPPRPDTFYSQTKLEAEKIVLSARRADDEPLGTVLRLGAVYGARIKGNYGRLLRALARGHFILVGKGDNRRTLVYDKDVARAAILTMRHPLAAGRVYNVTDGHFHKLHEVIAAMSEALKRKPPRFSVPVGPTRLAAGALNDIMRWIGKRSPISPAEIDTFTDDIAVEGKRIQSDLGFVPEYDLSSGWHEAVREMRDAGEL